MEKAGSSPKAETVAERLLLKGQDKREAWTADLPEADDPKRRVRASFLRSFILSIDNGLIEIGGFWIDGELDLEGLTIKPRLAFLSCRFSTPLMLDGATFPAISFRYCDLIRIYGSFIKCVGNFELSGSTVHSGVNLISAEIGGKLDLSGATIHGKDWVLFLDGSSLGELTLRGVQKADRISLLGARAHVLYDDFESWSTGVGEASFHRLDGFEYGTLGTGDFGPSPVDAKGRTDWLKKQLVAEGSFRPQPWNWLASVLGGMGHVDESRAISIAKHDEQLRSKSVRGTTALGLKAYGVLYGYGYKPMRLVGWVAAAWLTCAFIYLLAADANAMRPTDRAFLESRAAQCAGQWSRCEGLEQIYVPFNAFAYSFDLVLPISGLQQSKAWAPTTLASCGSNSRTCRPGTSIWIAGSAYSPLGIAAAAAGLFERLFGWLAGLMLVSVATGLVKRN